MSIPETFLNAGKQLLLATENLKRLDEKVSRLADDVAGVNVRLVRVGTILAMEEATQRHRRTQIRSGDTA